MARPARKKDLRKKIGVSDVPHYHSGKPGGKGKVTVQFTSVRDPTGQSQFRRPLGSSPFVYSTRCAELTRIASKIRIIRNSCCSKMLHCFATRHAYLPCAQFCPAVAFRYTTASNRCNVPSLSKFVLLRVAFRVHCCIEPLQLFRTDTVYCCLAEVNPSTQEDWTEMQMPSFYSAGSPTRCRVGQPKGRGMVCR